MRKIYCRNNTDHDILIEFAAVPGTNTGGSTNILNPESSFRSMNFDPDIGDELAVVLRERFPELPKGKVWIKYGKQRIYFNDKQEDIDYGFHIQINSNDIVIGDFMEEYWLEKLDIESIDEFQEEVEDLYYQIAYPLDSRFPSTTVREIRQHRRFEAVILDETATSYKINPISMDVDLDLDKDNVEVQKTPRTHGGEPIYLVLIHRDVLEEVADYIEEKEDEADRAFMQQMQQSVGSSIKVETEKKTESKIHVDEGEERTCINCHTKFTYTSSDNYREFCSPDCVKEYQQER